MENIRFLMDDGVRLAAEAHGPEIGPPLLLLHGGGQTRGAWGATAQALARRGFRAVALDLRGHGESDWAADGGYSLDRFAADLRAVAATLARPPVLVGASLGGLASMLACGEAPKVRAAAVVLVDIVPLIEQSGTDHVVGFMRATAGGFDSVEEAADAIAAYLPHRPRPRHPGGLTKNLRQREDGRFYWRWDPAFVAPRDGWNPQEVNRRLEAALRAINAPVLMVRGGKSEVVSKTSLDHFRRVLPEAEVVEIPEARHMVAGDDNDAFLGAILDFVSKHAVQPHE